MEEQIREHERAIIQLKRSRNSLLNVSTLPPEVLGNIFGWNVVRQGDFGGLEGNFLLVCHHWFEVASCTPELWSFWGNNLWDWAKRHSRYPEAPLDLVLGEMRSTEVTLDDTLRIALQDRATRDTIRRVHLRTESPALLSSILSPLTAGSEGPRSSSVESLILRYETISMPADVSDFFAHCRFPKLQHLELFNCTVSSWDLFASRTAILITLDLNFGYSLTPPTVSQVLSILASNPALRKVSLSGYQVPRGGGGGPSPWVSLHNLKELKLVGDLRGVFGLLNQLDHPTNMVHLDITLDDCVVEDISHLIGPYIRDYLQRRGKLQTGLGLFLMLPFEDTIVLHVGDIDGVDFSTPAPARMNTFIATTIQLKKQLPEVLRDKVTIDLIAHVPREEIVYLQTCGIPLAMGEISTQLPNLRGLHFVGTPLHTAFPESNLDMGDETFPSLRYVLLDRVIVDCGDWGPLTTFLDCRATSGNRLHTLVIVGSQHMGPAERGNFEKVVQEFAHLEHPSPLYYS